ncbi:hypothetical protein ARV1_gp33 [Acidianus rod-shaped virus 1]|uniref:Uncharacterized protein n=1 Tax=Acidianus rod-shaped virus 1 TaxID=309181 RepID=Q50I38_9VIRU|nr:hypothetical protein ARV1_gp33 [Acidianus rod-shaped virus 1]CAI44188.1 hypothetical protein [Acidianus rod-shaped virus 1]
MLNSVPTTPATEPPKPRSRRPVGLTTVEPANVLIAVAKRYKPNPPKIPIVVPTKSALMILAVTFFPCGDPEPDDAGA